jgi:hypothetical protein
MARDYAKKLEAMRAYYRTPAGQAASKRSHANEKIKRGLADRAMKIKPQALSMAIENWSRE